MAGPPPVTIAFGFRVGNLRAASFAFLPAVSAGATHLSWPALRSLSLSRWARLALLLLIRSVLSPLSCVLGLIYFDKARGPPESAWHILKWSSAKRCTVVRSYLVVSGQLLCLQLLLFFLTLDICIHIAAIHLNNYKSNARSPMAPQGAFRVNPPLVLGAEVGRGAAVLDLR